VSHHDLKKSPTKLITRPEWLQPQPFRSTQGTPKPPRKGGMPLADENEKFVVRGQRPVSNWVGGSSRGASHLERDHFCGVLSLGRQEANMRGFIFR